MLMERAWALHLIVDEASPSARDSNEAEDASNRRCYPHTKQVGLDCVCAIELPVQDEDN